MTDLRKLKQDILANGKVDGPELELLRNALYADGKIGKQEADFLVDLHKGIQRVTPAFEQFFYQAMKDYALADGSIGKGEADWLRRMLLTNGRIDDRKKQFLHEVRGEARLISPEFQKLYDECLK